MKTQRRLPLLAVVPIWFMVIVPSMWLIFLPLKFLLITFAFWLCSKAFSGVTFRELFRQSFLRAFIASIVADLTATAVLFLSQGSFGGWWYEYITTPVVLNPLDNPYSLSLALFAILLAVFVSYLLHKKVTFKNFVGRFDLQRKLALGLAIITIPVFYLMPSRILYDENYSVYTFTNHLVWNVQNDCTVTPVKPVSVECEELSAENGFTAGYYLIEAINTAKKATSDVTAEPEYRIHFRNPSVPDDTGVDAELWFLQDGRALFRVNGQFYLADEYQSAETLKVFTGEAQAEADAAKKAEEEAEAAQNAALSDTVTAAASSQVSQ